MILNKIKIKRERRFRFSSCDSGDSKERRVLGMELPLDGLANLQFLPQGPDFPSHVVCSSAPIWKNPGYFPETAEGREEEKEKEVKFIRSP